MLKEARKSHDLNNPLIMNMPTDAVAVANPNFNKSMSYESHSAGRCHVSPKYTLSTNAPFAHEGAQELSSNM